MEPSEELDLHLRRHRLGSCGGKGIQFDWNGLVARGLHLIPAYEVDSKPVYRRVLDRALPARFHRSDGEAGSIPDPDAADFFAEVESAVTSLADAQGDFVYVGFYTEEAYLALTEERALELFDSGPGEMLGASLLHAVAEEVLRMRRHRHGIRVFEEAARHHAELQRRLGRAGPGFPPWP